MEKLNTKWYEMGRLKGLDEMIDILQADGKLTLDECIEYRQRVLVQYYKPPETYTHEELMKRGT